MNHPNRALLAISVVGMALAAAHVMNDNFSPLASRSPEQPAVALEFLSATEREVLLNARSRAVVRRLKTRLHIVNELVAQRMTLLEAAGQFRDLNQELTPQEYRHRCKSLFMDDHFRSPEYVCARQVIACVDKTLRDDETSPTPEIVKRLEIDLKQHLDTGTLRFPD